MARYTNLDGTTPDKGLGAILKWQVGDRLMGRRARADDRDFVTPSRSTHGEELASGAPAATWIGHATFALRLGGKLVVTDPVWSSRLHTIARRVAPGVPLETMPRIDVVTISHAHYDHLDLPTLTRIGPGTLYVVPRGVGPILTGAGLPRVVELSWFESHQVGDLVITLVPAQHWSMRTPWDKNTTLWGGFVYASGEGVAYHAGDTAFSEQVFETIARRAPAIDWAMLPIGAYDPAWFMQPQHMNPEEAVAAWSILGARQLLAMHWGTFKLTDEHLGEPPIRARAEWERLAYAPRDLTIFDVGERRLLA